MAPNLLIVAQKLVKPHKWFHHKKLDDEDSYRTEQWETPVPGTYEYDPDKGWALIATGRPVKKLEKPIPVKYSRALRRNFLQDDYNNRKRLGDIVTKDGKTKTVGFFMLDDGVAYVNDFDENREFIPGPYKLWCIDAFTGTFREMLKCDDPNRRNSKSSKSGSNSRASSVRQSTSAANSPNLQANPDPRKPPSVGSKMSASRASSIAHAPISQTTTRTSSVFDDYRSPRSSAKNLAASDSITTAPTSPNSSIRNPLDDVVIPGPSSRKTSN